MANFINNLDGKMIFNIFIGGIITIVLLSSAADQVFLQTNTDSRSNATVTAPVVNGTLDLLGRSLVAGTTPIVTNASNVSGLDLQGTGVTIISGTSATTGLLTVQLTVNDTESAFGAQSVNITYSYVPDGFLNDSGARSISTLIIIIGALAILVSIIVFLWPSVSKLSGFNNR